MRMAIKIAAVAIILIVGVVFCPRPRADVSPRRVLDEVLRVNSQSDSVDRIHQDLLEGCIPILEGTDTVSGRHTWVIRLKIPPPKRYPWLEVWVDKKNSVVLAWKEWGLRNGQVTLLGRYLKMRGGKCFVSTKC